MSPKQILKKLNQSCEAERLKLLADSRKMRRRKNSWYHEQAERQLAEASKLNYRTFSGLIYKVRSNYFENARGTCGFNPETMEGHSYRWYSLVTRVKGVVILNNYRYSSETSIHIWRTAGVLRALGIKYKTLKAPGGLQNLGKAVDHELACMAYSLVRRKYSRGNKQKSGYFAERMRTFETAELKLLAQLGYKTSRKMRDAALAYAERERKERNERLREKSILRKKTKAVAIVSDFKNKMHGATDGIHVIKSSSNWAWNIETGIALDRSYSRGRSTFQWERERAVREGFSKVYVHSKEARHLEVVRGAE